MKNHRLFMLILKSNVKLKKEKQIIKNVIAFYIL